MIIIPQPDKKDFAKVIMFFAPLDASTTTTLVIGHRYNNHRIAAVVPDATWVTEIRINRPAPRADHRIMTAVVRDGRNAAKVLCTTTIRDEHLTVVVANRRVFVQHVIPTRSDLRNQALLNPQEYPKWSVS